MNRTGACIDVGHITSAIRACWAAEGRRETAAKFLFQLGRSLGLTPNIATYTCLIGAYAQAGLCEVLAAYHEMRGLGIDPDSAFAETYLGTVLWPLPQDRQGAAVEAELVSRPPERLAAAREALADFKSVGVELTALSARIAKALRALETRGQG
ncbi:PPR4 [Symbiodinium pilosum]|uniref:PPR4 protein n=1 Tax=Symbiodinium pilosum TaxID=2952 RepID=A0A812SIQ7_SYMPI|nr:PPR4 [Symbiodinium pilosum]